MSSEIFSPNKLAISIVSHGQGSLIGNLLEDLEPLILSGAKVLLTLNIPENEDFLVSLKDKIQIIRNKKPKGFGENHNLASSCTDCFWFAVLYPDIRFDPKIFRILVSEHLNLGAGVSAPRVLNNNGQIEDSLRLYPSVTRILNRTFRRFRGLRLTSDYEIADGEYRCVDWAAGMFLLFKREDFCKIGGFDTRYFMYLEDTDICYRFSLVGLPTIAVTSVNVIHEARRATSKSFKHLSWHISSMLRFIFIVRYWEFWIYLLRNRFNKCQKTKGEK